MQSMFSLHRFITMRPKIKAFRAKLHGVNDTKFFIFRLCNIYA